MHEAPGNARIERPHEGHVREQGDGQLRVRLVRGVVALGRLEVEVRRVEGRGDRIGDLGARLPAKFVAYGQRHGSIARQVEQLARRVEVGVMANDKLKEEAKKGEVNTGGN